MKAAELCYQSAAQLGELIRKREISPVEVTEEFLARTETLEPRLNSYITLLREESLAAAQQAEKEIQGGTYLGPLHGIPVGLKDLYNTAGIRTTSGSGIFRDYIPQADCTVAKRFKAAGAHFIGKLNMTEFAYDPTGDNLHYGPARNPWNTECMTGGSSSGSASAVASGECPIAMGSDTGGSVRIPAALCGVVGHKPTYGLISRYGLTPLSWSLDHAGPLTRTVEDTALVLNALVGHDPQDPSSANVPATDYTKALDGNVRGLRIGVPKEYIWELVDPEVDRVVKKAIDQLGKLGATVQEVSIPHLNMVPLVTAIVIAADVAGAHGDLLRARSAEFGPLVRLRVEMGLFITSADYLKAQRARSLLNREFHQALNQVDLLVTPTISIPAPKYSDMDGKAGASVRQVRDALTRFTRLFNMSGLPTISVPCGFSSGGLPIGLQLAGRPFADATVLKAAHAYEQSAGWYKQRPPL